MEFSAEIQKRIDAIREDRFSGARDLAARAAEVLILAARTAPRSVPAVASALVAAQPTMAPIFNLARRAEAAGNVETACREFLDGLEHSAVAVAANAAALIEDGMTIMTHSSSATVMGAFRAVHEAGRRFAVIATESRPQREGVTLAGRLGAIGIPVTLIIDAAVYRFLPQAQMVFIGADSVSPAGLVNKTGTSLVAMAASARHVPVYALCGSEKFLSTSYVLPEESSKDPREILERDLRNVSAANYYFDTTSLEYFTGIISEEGVIAPADLKQRLQKV